MSEGHNQLAQLLLSNDCGMIGFSVANYSSVYFPIRRLHALPTMRPIRLFGANNKIVVHCQLAQENQAGETAYRICFWFQLARITKIHFDLLDQHTLSAIEQSSCELPVDMPVFPDVW